MAGLISSILKCFGHQTHSLKPAMRQSKDTLASSASSGTPGKFARLRARLFGNKITNAKLDKRVSTVPAKTGPLSPKAQGKLAAKTVAASPTTPTATSAAVLNAQTSPPSSDKEALASQQNVQPLTMESDTKISASASGKLPPVKEAIPNISTWEKVGGKKGSNEGGRYIDAQGGQWYCKFPKNADIVHNEILAAKLYEKLGVKVASVQFVKDAQGNLGIASKWVGGLKSLSDANELAQAPGACKGFIFDAWLANWDVVGLCNDNLLVDSDGSAVRMDTGGALLFRGMGAPKGKLFDDQVGEFLTLRDHKLNPQAAPVFKHVTAQDIRDGCVVLAMVEDQDIKDLVYQFGPGTLEAKNELMIKLIARRDNLLSKAGDQPEAALPLAFKQKLAIPVVFNQSTFEAVNRANTALDAKIFELAEQGELAALKSLTYEVIDKPSSLAKTIDTGSGVSLERRLASEHPSSTIRDHLAQAIKVLETLQLKLPKPEIFNQSSVPAINTENTTLDASICTLAKEGNMQALKSLTYRLYDKKTGAVIGTRPVSVHPNNLIREHHQQAIHALEQL